MSCAHIQTEVKTEQEDLRSKTGGFLCPACGEQLFNEKYFIEHIRERHYNPDLQVQTQGEEHSLLNESAEKENGDVTRQDSYCVQNRCDLIKSEIKTEQSETVGETGGFLCSVCGEQFLVEESFVEHIYEHVSESGKRKRTRRGEPHNDVISGVKKKPSNSCPAPENSNPLNSQKICTTTSEKSFRCSYCSYTVRTKFHFFRHQRLHTGEKPYKCLECSYAAANKSALKYHLKTHSGEKPYKCLECSYATALKSNLKDHLKTHTGEKPFKCPECSYASAQKSHLKYHLKTHTGEKPFKCPDCSYAAVRKSTLKDHLKTHTGEKPFKCPDCSYAAVRKSALKVHQKTHTREKLFKCPDCSYAAARKSILKDHLKTHTG